MTELSFRIVLEVGVVALLAAAAGFFGISALQKKAWAVPDTIFGEDPDTTAFIFDGEVLLDATPDALRLLATGPSATLRGSPWTRLMTFLAPRFPDSEQKLRHLPDNGDVMLQATGRDSTLTLRAQFSSGITRIVLSDAETGLRSDLIAQRAQSDELAQLRDAVAASPYMIWREAENGDVVWANAAYLAAALHQLAPEEEIVWPLPRLIPHGTKGPRVQITLKSNTPMWFELLSFDDTSGDRLIYALPVDGTVRAENSLREFRQTLAQTFADLPIGLAIFDRQRQLVLFNPALLDLTALQPDFLSRRPTLFAFLDAMREGSMIPEPKDYRSWRKQMTDLEKAAATGVYEETWSLPSGQTYRVIGRPHPNGALALMFEDISTEMTRTRRYRADLELGQSVIDAVDEAIVVFSQSGQLVMSNAAYTDLWDHDPAGSLAEEGIASLCAHWRDGTSATPLWTEVEHFVATLGLREAWTADARLNDGRSVCCRFTPLPGGATLVGFRCALTVPEQVPALLAG